LAENANGAAPPNLSLHQTVRFALTSFPLAAIAIAVAIYLPQHFARDFGLELTAIGAAFALVRLIDVPLDPLLGLAMDRTRTPLGRYRIWMLVGAPVTAVAVYMLFMAPQGIDTGYVMLWLLVMYLGTSMLGLSHAAWGASLAATYNDRARLFGVMGAMGVAGMTLVLTMPVLSRRLGMGEPSAGVQWMGWFIVLAIPIAVLISAATTRERVVATQARHERFKFKEYVALVFHPSMGRIVLADFFLALGPTWEGTLYMFYFTDGRGFTAAAASATLMFSLGAGLLGAPLIGRLATVIGKHRALIATTGAYVLSMLSLTLVPNSAGYLATAPIIFCGFLYPGFTVLLRAMTADVSDEVRLAQGKERAALLYALTSLTSKIASAMAIWMTFSTLAQIGYAPAQGGSNTPEALQGLTVAYLLGPVALVALGAVCMFGYKLGPARAAEIRRLLERRDAQAAEVSSAEVSPIEEAARPTAPREQSTT